MEKGKLQRLEAIALERLVSSANDEEKWSFLFHTKGSESFGWYRWRDLEEEECNGEVQWLEEAIDPERTKELRENPEAVLTDEEERLWREKKGYWYANGSDRGLTAYIVPIMTEANNAEGGYALFVRYLSADEMPELESVFDTAEAARAYLADNGIVA